MSDRIKYYRDTKKYFRVHRQVAANVYEESKGYVLAFSRDFVLLQETDDFLINGYSIFPRKAVGKIQYSNKDKYYDRMMRLEGLVDKIVNKHKVDLTSWTSIFRSIKLLKLNVVIENEDPDDTSFDIGPIIRVTNTAVYIRYFDAQGFLDREPTKILFSLITIVKFDDRYTNTISKYLRERKSGSKRD